jgi:hypothetical protein
MLFLWKEGVSAADVHRRVAAVRGDAAQVAEQYFDGLRHEGKWARQILLLHENAKPYSSTQTTQKLASHG